MPPRNPRLIVRWDLDKTYLHTDFDTLRGLFRAAVETPESKRTIPGAAIITRELRATHDAWVTIVSGSPEQMRQAIESRLRLDGVMWDEFALKPSLGNLVRLRFKALKDQVGYKLPALLDARTRSPAGAPEVLFGDDAEADAFVYSLYADLLEGRVSDKLLNAVMEHAGSYPDVIARTLRLVHKVGRIEGRPVHRAFIHLERKSDPVFFRRYGARLVPVTDYFQAALVLCADGWLSPLGAAHVAASVMAERGAEGVLALTRGAYAMVEGGHLAPEALVPVVEAISHGESRIAMDPSHVAELAQRLREAPKRGEVPELSPSIDYVSALEEDRDRWESAKRDVKARHKAAKVEAKAAKAEAKVRAKAAKRAPPTNE